MALHALAALAAFRMLIHGQPGEGQDQYHMSEEWNKEHFSGFDDEEMQEPEEEFQEPDDLSDPDRIESPDDVDESPFTFTETYYDPMQLHHRPSEVPEPEYDYSYQPAEESDPPNEGFAPSHDQPESNLDF